MRNAVLEFEATHPSHLATITTHVFIHMPEHVVKWGPAKGSWAAWSERMVRSVRNASAVEQRSMSALSNGHAMWRQSMHPKVTKRADVTEHCNWWVVESRRRVQDPNKTMTAAEKLKLTEALRIDGSTPEDCNVRTSSGLVDDESSVFRTGDSIKLESTTVNSKFATKRKDAVRDHTFVVTLHDNGLRADGTPRPLKPMVAQVSKIASWQASNRKDEVGQHAMKVKVLSQTATSDPNTLSVNVNLQPRGSPATGEWAGMRHSVARRAPLMSPEVVHSSGHDVVLSSNVFDACMVPQD
eukprot:jgi/Bigna1/145905/aug1.105_g20613